MSFIAKLTKRMARRQLSGWSAGSIEEQRARQEHNTRFLRLPAGIRCERVSLNGLEAEWIQAPDSRRGAILYLHGGAYALCSINTHRELVGRLARATQVRALLIGYRLVPEHPFPAALQDALSAYRWLLTQGLDPSQIVLAGDSAGGGLAVAMLVALRDAGEPLPAGAVCISPWTDLALTGPSVEQCARIDPILDPESCAMYAQWYAAGHDLTSPLISPLYADLAGLPPLLIQVGTDEILLDDAKRLADRAKLAGVDVTLEIWKELFHVFHLFPFLPETRAALGHIAGFASKLGVGLQR